MRIHYFIVVNILFYYDIYLYYYLRSFSGLDFLFFSSKMFLHLYLNRDKIKGQSGKNITLTPTKTLPKKI